MGISNGQCLCDYTSNFSSYFDQQEQQRYYNDINHDGFIDYIQFPTNQNINNNNISNGTIKEDDDDEETINLLNNNYCRIIAYSNITQEEIKNNNVSKKKEQVLFDTDAILCPSLKHRSRKQYHITLFQQKQEHPILLSCNNFIIFAT